MNILGYALSVVEQVAILFIMIIAGFILTKCKLIDQSGAKQITNVLFYLVTPCVVIHAFAGTTLSENSLQNLWTAVIAALLSHGVGILLAMIFFRKQGSATDGEEPKPDHQTAVLRYATIFENCGFFAIPLASALLGTQGTFITSIYIVIFNILLWTVGVSLFEGGGGKISFRKAFINPGIIGVVLGLPIFLFSIPLPNILDSPVSFFAGTNTPLAMIIIGAYLAFSGLGIKTWNRKFVLSVCLRCIVIPAISLVLLLLIGVKGNALIACMIPISAPVAANTIMFAAKFDSDTALASRAVSVSTVLTIVTIPIILSLCNILSAS